MILKKHNMSMSISLYSNQNLEQAFEVLEETGEQSPELSIEQDALQVRAIDFARYYRQLSADETMIDDEIKRLTELKRKAQKRIEFIKDSISDAMQIAGIEKIETPTIKISFRSSESVQITEEWLIPSAFVEVKTSINKAEIRKRLMKGEKIEGTYLELKKHIQIR